MKPNPAKPARADRRRGTEARHTEILNFEFWGEGWYVRSTFLHSFVVVSAVRLWVLFYFFFFLLLYLDLARVHETCNVLLSFFEICDTQPNKRGDGNTHAHSPLSLSYRSYTKQFMYKGCVGTSRRHPPTPATSRASRYRTEPIKNVPAQIGPGAALFPSFSR